MSPRRLAGASGLVFVALVAATNLAQGAAGRPFGDPDEAGYLADLLAFYTDAGWVLTLVGVVLPFVWGGLAIFAVGLAVTLARAGWGGPGAAWSLVGLVGVIMQNAIFPVVVAMDAGQFRSVSDGGALDLGLHHTHEALFGLNSLSLAIALVGFSAAMGRDRSAVRWLPRLGFVAAAALAASTMDLGTSVAGPLFDGLGLLGFVLWLVFVATASMWLVRQPAPVHPTTPALATQES